eukprot:GEZU01020699.1.p1 GENE.GEZU01020699.1~~GEZU01020699.1.p1  ORF type:complete len:568 (+),score=133.54 GEZU01020699.1:15-1718(+)
MVPGKICPSAPFICNLHRSAIHVNTMDAPKEQSNSSDEDKQRVETASTTVVDASSNNVDSVAANLGTLSIQYKDKTELNSESDATTKTEESTNASAIPSDPPAAPTINDDCESSRRQLNFVPGNVAESLKDLQIAVSYTMSDHPKHQLEGTKFLRKILSIERTPPIDEVVSTGVLPRLVAFLQRFDAPMLQYEAAWALTNIASGTTTHVRRILEHGALPVFVNLIKTDADISMDLREQCVWAIGNCARGSPAIRDYLHDLDVAGALKTLLSMKNLPLSVRRNTAWASCNLAGGKPGINIKYFLPTLDLLASFTHETDDKILTDTYCGLSYLSHTSNDITQLVLDHPKNILAWVVNTLSRNVGNDPIATAALRFSAKFLTGDDRQTQAVIDAGIISILPRLLTHSKRSIRKETCWAIANINAGTRAQIQQIIDSNLIPKLIEILNNGEYDVSKGALCAVVNATINGSEDQIAYLISCGVLKPILDFLTVREASIVHVALEGIEGILKAGKKEAAKNGLHENPYQTMIEDLDGAAKIEALCSYADDNVCELAIAIFEEYFSDENLPPAD